MNIIHFDIGSNMALAHNACDVLVVDHFTATGSRQERAAQTLRWLVRRAREMRDAGIKFDVCHYDRPFTRGYDATRCLWGIAGIVEAVFGGDTVLLDSTPQSVTSFALAALGRKPTRVAMKSAERRVAAAQEKLWMIEAGQMMGYVGDNEHEADAVCGLRYAEAFCARGTPGPKRKKK